MRHNIFLPYIINYTILIMKIQDLIYIIFIKKFCLLFFEIIC